MSGKEGSQPSKERKRKRKGKGRDRTGAGEERKKDGKQSTKKGQGRNEAEGTGAERKGKGVVGKTGIQTKTKPLSAGHTEFSTSVNGAARRRGPMQALVLFSPEDRRIPCKSESLCTREPSGPESWHRRASRAWHTSSSRGPQPGRLAMADASPRAFFSGGSTYSLQI